MRTERPAVVEAPECVPYWWIDTDFIGWCQKHLPHKIKGDTRLVRFCSMTKLPCPVNGIKQFELNAAPFNPIREEPPAEERL